MKDEEDQEPPPTQEGSKDVVDVPDNPVVGDPDEGKVFMVVEEQASFPGGEAKLAEYLGKNIKYPAIARENGITGRVYINFIVGKDGKVRDTKLLRGIGGGCDEEALRVVRAMPDWKPGRQNGRNVDVYVNVPVVFTLK